MFDPTVKRVFTKSFISILLLYCRHEKSAKNISPLTDSVKSFRDFML